MYRCGPHPDNSLTRTSEFLLFNSLSPTTITAYKSAFQSYKSFVMQVYGRNTPLFPPLLTHLVSFIAHCYQMNLAVSTTLTTLSALSFIFKLSASEDLTQHFLIKKMIQGFKNAKPTCDPRPPITPVILGKLIQALPFTTDSIFSKTMLHAMVVLVFCAFLRVGEITKTHNKKSHYLLFRNVASGIDANNRGVIDITLPHFKHSKFSTTIHLQQNRPNSLLCPYKTLLDYIFIRKHSSPGSPLFSFMDDSPVLRHYFTTQLRAALLFCKLDLVRYQAHSFRIGAATTAAATGYTEVQIQKMSRWNSDAFKKYIRIPSITLG
ncbi:uncharacterized protein LOC125673205 isoform X1 [Ostrea edulis]|uniref:uncharacterized protein LOC125673205 isoform X1 n=1 Tax=Ostrea edulis TaxID=37623 RepID=UPI0024AEDAFA|nr:uncharacterized protein LOC125673205 isoform X1 [Ostrea edulis]